MSWLTGSKDVLSTGLREVLAKGQVEFQRVLGADQVGSAAHDQTSTDLVIAALLTFSALAVRAHEESLEAIESFLHGLADDGALSEAQHQVIDQLMSQGNLSALDVFLRAQETAVRITRDTRLYVNALLGIGEPEITQAAVSRRIRTTATSRCWAASTRSRPAHTTATIHRAARSTTASGATPSVPASMRCRPTASGCTSST